MQQLETAVRKQGLRGAAIGGSVLGEDFSDPKFHPVWAKAEELGAVLFIHPQSTPELAKRFKGNGWLSNTIGNPLDTTIALQHLIFEGTLDRFPGLKMLAAHGGGYLPSYAARGDHACFVSPQNCNPNIKLKKKPSEYLNQLYFDALVFTPEGLRHLVAQVGASQIVLGSDHPIPWEQHPVDHVFATTTLPINRRWRSSAATRRSCLASRKLRVHHHRVSPRHYRSRFDLDPCRLFNQTHDLDQRHGGIVHAEDFAVDLPKRFQVRQIFLDIDDIPGETHQMFGTRAAFG